MNAVAIEQALLELACEPSDVAEFLDAFPAVLGHKDTLRKALCVSLVTKKAKVKKACRTGAAA